MIGYKNMRKLKFFPGEFYHIYNRGVNKQRIFVHHTDYWRFLISLLLFQAPVYVPKLSRTVQHSVLDISDKLKKEVIAKREVELVQFTLMPNHFHTLLYEYKEGGISRYMQRVLNSYTKYFNRKYERNGHLFQGPFQAVYMETNEQLLYLSAYIHRNPHELVNWRDKEHLYPWSSYQDYLGDNRWSDLLVAHRILQQFSSASEYRKHVSESGAKELKIN